MHEMLMNAFQITIALVFPLIGWIFKMVFSTLKDVEKNHNDIQKHLADHKLHSAETFATKVDVDKGFDRVMAKLDSMDEKLDKKADK